MNTENYRKQHAEIMELAHAVLGSMGPDLNLQTLPELHKNLLTLSGKLKLHLAMEDNALYPYLLSSDNNEASGMAKRYQDEMGELKRTFDHYASKWATQTKIKEDYLGFITETKAIFSALTKRIKAENTELYPMAEKI